MNTSFAMMKNTTPAASTTTCQYLDDHRPDHLINHRRSKSFRSYYSKTSNFSNSIYEHPRWRRPYSRKPHHGNQYNGNNNNNNNHINNNIDKSKRMMLPTSKNQQQHQRNRSVSGELPTVTTTIPFWIQFVTVAADNDDSSVTTDASTISSSAEEDYNDNIDNNNDVVMEDVTATTESATTSAGDVMHENSFSSLTDSQNPAPVCSILVRDENDGNWMHTCLDALPLCFRVSFDGDNSIEDNFDHVELQGNEILDFASALLEYDRSWMFVVTFQSSGITTCLQATDLITTLQWFMVGSASNSHNTDALIARESLHNTFTTTGLSHVHHHHHHCGRPWQRGWNFGGGTDVVIVAVDDDDVCKVDVKQQ